jgi:thiol-disulfide isomerase/thioredoxin
VSAGRAVVALVAGLLALAGCTSGSGPGDGDAPRAAPTTDVSTVRSTLQPCPAQPDQPAADTALTGITLDCVSGGTLDLGRAPGVPTVLNLWASWCGPCREELPAVQQVAAQAGDRLRVLGVISKDGVPQATSFAADAGTTFPGAYDLDGRVMAAVGVVGLPATLLLAPDGSVAFTKVGAFRSADELRQAVAEHLGVQL